METASDYCEEGTEFQKFNFPASSRLCLSHPPFILYMLPNTKQETFRLQTARDLTGAGDD